MTTQDIEMIRHDNKTLYGMKTQDMKTQDMI